MSDLLGFETKFSRSARPANCVVLPITAELEFLRALGVKASGFVNPLDWTSFPVSTFSRFVIEINVACLSSLTDDELLKWSEERRARRAGKGIVTLDFEVPVSLAAIEVVNDRVLEICSPTLGTRCLLLYLLERHYEKADYEELYKLLPRKITALMKQRGQSHEDVLKFSEFRKRGGLNLLH